MTAVAAPSDFQSLSRTTWVDGSSIKNDDVARMFLPRKTAQRTASSSSLSSQSSGSSATTIHNTPNLVASSSDWGTTVAKKSKPQRNGPQPTSKALPFTSISTTKPQSILTSDGTSAVNSMTSLQQSNGTSTSQPSHQNGSQRAQSRQVPMPGENGPMLYLLSLNGTFERKTIAVPIFPDVLKIGRQTNIKTLPTPTNGFFDSKVLSRQHAEIWADREGKIWIRDIKSSNGTFVNGTRLSLENRDSEPHELQTQDQLELGIDIVSEDQKTVVHHKVAAKVEHAGYLGLTNNVLEMNFGDLDPAAHLLQNGNAIQSRGRATTQGPLMSNGRGNHPGGISTMAMAPKPMNSWLAPITTEQIVKRLAHEMRMARLQNQDLIRTEHFLNALISNEDIRNMEKPAVAEPVKPISQNGSVSSFNAKTRFLDPPAPPPQQPLPEKPDNSRPLDASPPSVRRTATERPFSSANISPVRTNGNGDVQMVSLLEALQQAKKEIDEQNDRVRALEEQLQSEREARETAEGYAKRLELESLRMTSSDGGPQHGGSDTIFTDPSFHNLAEQEQEDEFTIREVEVPIDSTNKDIKSSASVEAARLQQTLERVNSEMQEMKRHLEAYRQRAELAELERDEGRTTLAEMVAGIRRDEAARAAREPSRGRSHSHESPMLLERGQNLGIDPQESFSAQTRDCKALEPAEDSLGTTATFRQLEASIAAPMRPLAHESRLVHHSAPYASMLGVVLIGIGLMAYMNGGWQKAEVFK